MGDSDDEYDRKRRDKFRGERGGGGGGGGDSYQNRREDRNNRDWQDRRGGARPDYRDYRQRERAYSPGPPVKRMRNDWEDGRSRFANHDNYGMYNRGYGDFGGGGAHFNHHPGHQMDNRDQTVMNPDLPTQPCMMTLKQFLATQDDSISDSDAITKYGEYKLDFKRQQLNEFFVAHKDEEWFKIKYHPEESLKRKEEQIGYLRRRVEVFLELLEKGDITQVPVDTTNTDQLARLLDTAVIKLEGGTDEDLKVLDEKPQEIPPKVESKVEVKEPETDNGDATEDKVDAVEKIEENEDKVPEKKEEKSKKRHRSSDSSSSSNSDSDSESGAEKEEKKKESKESSVEKMVEEPEEKPEVVESNENGDEPADLKNESNDSVKDEAEEEKMDQDVEDSEEKAKKSDEDQEKEEKDEVKPEIVDLVDEPKVKRLVELHKTSSIFLRNLAPTVTKAEVETMCRRYDGFLRVAIADPLVERRWFRRGWVSFKRENNIKEICWNMNNMRLRECELGAIINRDLSRRVRPVNGITAHKTICKTDIKLCAKIAHGLDEKAGLWNADDDGQERAKVTFGLQSKNPVLKNITDYLIEEASAEEDELLGLSGESKSENEGEMLERDPELISVLDKIILYLRIVHSVDYYNHCEYPYEDEMPNRCGIIHARGPPPQTKITTTDIQEYMRNFESKLTQLLASNVQIPAEELVKLGSKDVDAEVEKFITANSQELSKDKWLCPLSGKKFKGPDYIRKHIFNKHAEKVEEVKNEVEYFNNYMKDSKRPQLPEHPGNPVSGRKIEGAPVQGYRPPFPMHYPNNFGGHFNGQMRGRGGFGRGRQQQQDFRPVIHYRDLDDPRELDEFI